MKRKLTCLFIFEKLMAYRACTCVRDCISERLQHTNPSYLPMGSLSSKERGILSKNGYKFKCSSEGRKIAKVSRSTNLINQDDEILPFLLVWKLRSSWCDDNIINWTKPLNQQKNALKVLSNGLLKSILFAAAVILLFKIEIHIDSRTHTNGWVCVAKQPFNWKQAYSYRSIWKYFEPFCLVRSFFYFSFIHKVANHICIIYEWSVWLVLLNACI